MKIFVRVHAIAPLIFGVLISACLSFGQIPDKKSNLIEGHVLDAVTREPLIGANILVMGTAIGATTNPDGHFQIPNLAPGTYRLQASMIGYQSFIKTDIIAAVGKQVEVMIMLQPEAVKVSEYEITPTYFDQSGATPVSSQSLSNEEIRRAPGSNEDVVRAVAILPGVVQTSAGRNDLMVRGGAPSENLYVVDGHEIPNLNHFGTQGATGGPLSFVNLDFVRDVSFSTGGFGVEYGDRMSSVMDLQTEDGRTDRIGGKATISASQFGLNTEGPLGKNGSFIFSARRSYLDFIFKAAGFGFVPEYWDFLGKATIHPDKQNTLSFINIGALDNIRIFNDTPDQRLDNSRILGSSQNQYFSGLSWQHLMHGGILRTSLTRTFVDYDYLQTDTLLNPRFQSKSKEGETGLRTELTRRLAAKTTLTAGMQGKTALLDGSLLMNPIETSFGDSLLTIAPTWKRRAVKSAAYAQISQRMGTRWTLTAGGRADYFDGIHDKFAFSPRGSLSYALTDKIALSASGGIYRQAPSYIWLVTNPKNSQLKFEQADQLVLGIEDRIRPDTRIRIEGYFKKYHNYPASVSRPYLVLANTGAGYGGSEEGFAAFGTDELRSDGVGYARGIELTIQKRLSEIRCYGILSVSYGKTEFKAIDGVNRVGLYDQRLILNLSGGYQFSRAWEIASKFRFGTGTPYTPYDNQGKQTVAAYNSKRFPVFHTLDVRVDRRWSMPSWTLITYVDIQNIYSHKNVSRYRWNERKQIVETDKDIGILPVIGISAEF
jgi:hypothetical protein